MGGGGCCLGCSSKGGEWFSEQLREEAEREQAFNHSVQGSAAEMMKMAMLRVEASVPETFPLLQIHDEWIGEIKEGRDDLVERIGEAMQWEFEGVRLKVECASAESWGELK